MGGAVAERVQPKQNLNPNWAQLQQKISASSTYRRFKPTTTIPAEAPKLEPVVGKRKERSDEELKASVLKPISDDCSVTGELAMDCEMVGVGTDGRKHALGRVTLVSFMDCSCIQLKLPFTFRGKRLTDQPIKCILDLVNAWGNVVYDEFVRPMEWVVDFRTEISGIRPKDLKKAKEFGVVQKKVADLIDGKILVGHALHNDLKVLLLTHPKMDIRDTSQYQAFQRKGKRIALRHLAAQILGVKIQQREHCSVEDARAVMLIYQKHKKEWEKSVKIKLKLKDMHGRKKKKRKEFNDTEQSL